MKSAIRLTAAERDRAMRRLRDLTVGTAVASIVALAGLGTVAAASNPGSTADSGTTSAADSTSGSTATLGSTSTSSSSGLAAATTAPTTTSGNAHVSSGSS